MTTRHSESAREILGRKSDTIVSSKPNKIKVCAYGRVSSDTVIQENSFMNQKLHYESKYISSEDYEFVGFYGDEGKTGTTIGKRSEFLKMLEHAGLDVIFGRGRDTFMIEVSEREPLFNRIVVKDISRFTRNLNVIDAIRKLREKGVYIDIEQYNLSTEDPVNGEIMIQMLLMFSEFESKDKSKKVKFGQRKSMEFGVIAVAPYGYMKPSDGCKTRLEVIQKEAEIVNLIFKLYNYGKGIRVIINELNNLGIVSRSGKPFQKTTITNILKNPIYKGSLIRNRYSSGTIFLNKSATAKKLDKSQWIEKHNCDGIPVIVKPQNWDRVQAIMKRKTNYVNQVGIKKEVSLYANLILCGKCGERYQSNVDRGKRFYNCKTKKQHGIDACNNKNIYVDKLEAYLQQLASVDYRRTHLMELGVLLSNLQYKKKDIEDSLNKPKNRKNIEELSKKISENKSEHMIYMKERAKNLITEEIFEEMINPVIDEGKRLKREIEEALKSRSVFEEELSEISKEIKEIVKYHETLDTELTITDLIFRIDHIKVLDGNFSVQYKSDKFLNFNKTDKV